MMAYLFDLWIFLLCLLRQVPEIALQHIEELLGRLGARRSAGHISCGCSILHTQVRDKWKMKHLT